MRLRAPTAALALSLFSTAVFSADAMEILPVQGSVYLLSGAGSSNVVVQVGDDGVLVVDTSVPAMSSRILDAIHELSNRPIRYVLNTHAHPDHVGGNEAISRAGISYGGGNTRVDSFAAIYAHENVLNTLSAPTGETASMPSAAWPTDTYFTGQMEIHFNNEPIVMLHAPAAHTDGDSLVFFRRSDVVATGDVYITTAYPVIDLDHGGSINGLIDGLNQIIDIAVPGDNEEDGTIIVPGHGRLSDEYDVVVYRDMVTVIRDRIADMLKRGMTLDQVKAARPTFDYDGRYGAGEGGATTVRFVESVYRSLQKTQEKVQ
jgi:glyoxylase-like metal-dependent hydrolase (beta-lactamase superfamily II)